VGVYQFHTTTIKSMVFFTIHVPRIVANWWVPMQPSFPVALSTSKLLHVVKGGRGGWQKVLNDLQYGRPGFLAVV
jgi:hypothetical protein